MAEAELIAREVIKDDEDFDDLTVDTTSFDPVRRALKKVA
jgi:hypothetical protein